MIIFDKLLKAGGGNFGNSFWQMSSLIGLSKKYNVPVKFPENSLFQYFKNPPESYSHEPFFMEVKEKTYKFDWGQWDGYQEMFNGFTINISGWLQSSRYWEHCKEEVHQMLEIKDEYTAWIRAKYAHVFTKPTIAISIRRGDYVGNLSYHLLPIRYYLGALLKYFPDFRDNYNLVIFSDDVEYCKIHFGCLSNVYYAQGDAIEQHTLGRLMDNYVLANSTFSYWLAKLTKSPNPKVIVPKYLFAGKLLEREGNCTFWENEVQTEGWIEFDHLNYKIDLSDTTFTIPTYHDHNDRDENLTLATKQLKEDFVCKIIVGENQSSSFSHLGDRYMKFNYKDFHRTRMLNQMAYKAITPIVINFDCDIAIPPLQILEAVRLIRSGYDMVYPYDGRFARVPRTHYPKLSKLRDVGILTEQFKGTFPEDKPSVGGAIVFNKQSFIDGGMENEFFKSYGPEDQERYYRFTTLGYKVARIPGTLYHIDHKITLNSSMQQPNYKANEQEWERIQNLSPDVLRKYVDAWDFNTYDETYHDDIQDTKSPEIILTHLESLIKFESIVDIGCGNGSWNTGKYAYTGIDYNVYPKIPYYIDADLRDHLPDLGEWDLAICMEVAEHLDERYADTIIANLTKLSNQILFSAAIPGQDGENHLNLQWQSWWAEKFKQRGFYPYFKDIRSYLWHNPDVAPYYLQNMVLYTRNQPTWEYELDRIHPRMYLNLLV